MDRLEMREKLKEKLAAKRFEHSLGVEYTAGTMAFMYGIDYEKALIAGLLHDCAKYVSNDKKISKCEKRGIPISECEYKIVYIADYIEPNRTELPEMDIIRQEAYSDLDQCLLHILHNSVHYLCKKGAAVDPITNKTYEYYSHLRQE